MSDTLFDMLGDPADDILRTAYLSQNGLHRYTLNRIWGDPNRLLTFVMLNPSTADATKDDNTIRKCMGFARREGFDGIKVVNLYSWRATDPKDLWRARESDVIDITGGLINARTLRDTIDAAYRSGLPVVCAWGANAEDARVSWLVEEIQEANGALFALHVTKSGHPGHPLYLPANAELRSWTWDR